jgi:hypothetical protein
MRCCTNADTRFFARLRTALSGVMIRVMSALMCGVMIAVLALLTTAPSHAAQIEPLEARITLDDGEVLLNADFTIDLSSRLEDALSRGVTLSFKLECLIERPRDYWVSEHTATYTQNYRLTYSSLTRQYRLSIGNFHHNFATLTEAVRIMSRLSNLPIAETSLLRPATPYDISLRLSLDSSALPKPFQLDALTSNAWKLDAKTKRWRFNTPGTLSPPSTTTVPILQ